MTTEDAPLPYEDSPEPQQLPPRPPTPPWVFWLGGLAVALVVVEFGYRFYESNTSPEVRPKGVALKGVPAVDRTFDIPVSSPDPFHSLRVDLSGDNADEADLEAARMGFPGIVAIREETGAHREWSVPIRIVATENTIGRHSSVEDAFFSAEAHGPIGVGVRYRIDYKIETDPPGGDGLTALMRESFPASTRLTIRFTLGLPLPSGTQAYVSYARSPRLLHQALLRE